MLQKEISDLQVSTASLFSRDHVCVSIYIYVHIKVVLCPFLLSGHDWQF